MHDGGCDFRFIEKTLKEKHLCTTFACETHNAVMEVVIRSHDVSRQDGGSCMPTAYHGLTVSFLHTSTVEMFQSTGKLLLPF